jgi:hypothetical protein
MYNNTSYCKVGRITSSKNSGNDSRIIQIDFKNDNFKGSDIQFTAKVKKIWKLINQFFNTKPTIHQSKCVNNTTIP